MKAANNKQAQLRVFLILLTVILSSVFIFYVATRSTVLTHGFASYYTFSKMLFDGDELSSAYNDDLFHSKMAQYGFGGVKDIANNLPTSVFLFLPIVWLSPVAAKAVWVMLSVILLFLSLLVLFKTIEIKAIGNVGLLLISMTLLLYPVYNIIVLGQVYILLLFLFSISLYGLKNSNIWLTSAPLALILLLKGYGVIPVLFLLLTKRYREFFLSIGFIFVIFLITLPYLHFETWTVYFNAIFVNMGSSPSAASVAYQTVNSLVRHLFTYDAFWSPYPVIVLPNALLSILIAAIGLILIAFFLRRSLQISLLQLFSISVALNVILAPLAEEYHFVLFIPLIFIAASILLKDLKPHRRNIPFAVILFLIIALPIPYEDLQHSSFPVYLFAYPKLFAGIALLFLSSKINKIKG